MSANPIRGQLYVESITAVSGSSGTLIPSTSDDIFRIEYPQQSKTLYNAAGNVSSTVVMGQQAQLVINLRAMDSTSLDLLYTALRSSGIKTMRNGVSRLAAQTALIIRPKDGSTDDYFYSPGMSIAQAAQSRVIMFSRNQLHTDENSLRLVENVAVLDEPPSFKGTAAQIAAEYAGLSA